jgi:hypothetical protein
MKAVYKFELPWEGDRRNVRVTMPINAKVIDVAEQSGQLYLWAVCDASDLLANYLFYVRGTGAEIDFPLSAYSHVGTAHMRSGLVWHVFGSKGFSAL